MKILINLTLVFFLVQEVSSQELKKDSINNDSFRTSVYIDSLKQSLYSCYYHAFSIKYYWKQRGGELYVDISQEKGLVAYNKAYNYYLSLQEEANYDIPKKDRELISKALKNYSDIFHNPVAYSLDYEAFINELNKEINIWPKEITIYEDSVYIEQVDANQKKKVNIKIEGNTCIWELKGSPKIWITGNIPDKNETFEIYNSRLPLYLGEEKNLMIENKTQKLVEIYFYKCDCK